MEGKRDVGGGSRKGRQTLPKPQRNYCSIQFSFHSCTSTSTSVIGDHILHAPVGFVERATCCLGEPLILEGNVAFHDLALHVWEVETVYQPAYNDVGILLERVNNLVDLLCLQSRFIQSTSLRSLLHSVCQHVLQVRINCALVDSHDLPEHLVLSFTKPFFSLPPATFLCLP